MAPGRAGSHLPEPGPELGRTEARRARPGGRLAPRLTPFIRNQKCPPGRCPARMGAKARAPVPGCAGRRRRRSWAAGSGSGFGSRSPALSPAAAWPAANAAEPSAPRPPAGGRMQSSGAESQWQRRMLISSPFFSNSSRPRGPASRHAPSLDQGCASGGRRLGDLEPTWLRDEKLRPAAVPTFRTRCVHLSSLSLCRQQTPCKRRSRS
ncbi:PREDICTED: uncharacterized protein LOC106149639 [Chinchilla lanigera]|uniref:uncharacterized protein LOC106149639 n=1 Tax=Chinchilla lanigera TaxID=34839 RepID=UPI0006961A83|nr:PREDICTED: uncharacterized protein LOC106149639 [Chinchilla lanigera]